jgi:hypothetical protein
MNRTAILLTLLLGFSPSAALAQKSAASATCQAASPIAPLAGLSEASGLAISTRAPGRFWSHNDSGNPPILIGFDTKGVVTQRVALTGVSLTDWEAVAVGPCPSGSCVYAGDIGDNSAKRKSIAIYRFAEPAAGVQSVAVTDVFHATYPDGAHNAEALLIAPDARLYIVTKGDTGPVALYRFPSELRAGATVKLERVGDTIASVGKDERITDGNMSADGQWTVLRSRTSLAFYRTAELVAGNFREHKRVDLTPLGEKQGEGMALGSDNVVYVSGEGGGKSQPGTFANFACNPNP